MQLISKNFQIIEQESGLDGIFKQITKAGYTCYKTEKEITPESSEKFVKKMIENKHYAMLEHGTVYLKFHWDTTNITETVKYLKYQKDRFSVVNFVEETPNHLIAYVTTNYRVLVENGWLDDLDYLCEPTPYHEKRVTVRFNMDRVGTQSVERHRGYYGNSFAQESTRFCNYTNEKKFGSNGIKISIPHWTNEIEIGQEFSLEKIKEIHSQYLASKTNNNICNNFDKLHYWIAANDFCNFCYTRLIECGMSPEDARSILPLDINSEMVMTSYVSDWKHFFDLRTSKAETGRPHPDIMEIANKLQDCFQKNHIIV